MRKQHMPECVPARPRKQLEASASVPLPAATSTDALASGSRRCHIKEPGIGTTQTSFRALRCLSQDPLATLAHSDSGLWDQVALSPRELPCFGIGKTNTGYRMMETGRGCI